MRHRPEAMRQNTNSHCQDTDLYQTDRYERNEVKPSIDVATKMAEALGVSLDYLVGFADYELDNSLTQKILDIQKLNDEDRTAIIKTVDALIRDAKARKAYAS